MLVNPAGPIPVVPKPCRTPQHWIKPNLIMIKKLNAPHPSLYLVKYRERAQPSTLRKIPTNIFFHYNLHVKIRHCSRIYWRIYSRIFGWSWPPLSQLCCSPVCTRLIARYTMLKSSREEGAIWRYFIRCLKNLYFNNCWSDWVLYCREASYRSQDCVILFL